MKINNIQKEMINQLITEIEIEDKIKLYKENEAEDYIIKILETQKIISNPKQFGIFLEDVAEKILGLSPSINSEHDKMYNGKKIEIKSSTLLKKDLKTFQYNSIRMDYDYDYILFQNINFKEIKYYLLSKEKLLEIRDLWKGQKSFIKGIITMITFDIIEKYCKEINSQEDLMILNDY